jgi:hypothetical protein
LTRSERAIEVSTGRSEDEVAMFAHRRSSRPPFEELIIYALLVIIGAIPVTNALEGSGGFGVEATIGAIMVAIGAIGIVCQSPRVFGGDGGGSRNR